MCGLAGLQRLDRNHATGLSGAAMATTLAHRGPDAVGDWTCPSGTLELGFRRLAIRDLDPRANQPMVSASGRTVLAFNGEIYNTEELVARYCPGASLRTTSDSEVLLEAFERCGPGVLESVNGMFAAVFYCTESRTAWLARDGVGKKPLYVYQGTGYVAFASELRAFAGLPLQPDPDRVPCFLHFGYIPAPGTFYRHVTQLRPGERIQLRGGRVVARHRFHDPLTWSWGSQSRVDPDRIQELVDDSVARRTVSDVPVGTFLSGGVDSSLVAASLASSGHGRLPSFTVSFDEPRFNEGPEAAAVAAQLGLPHRDIRVRIDELPGLVDDYLDCYEQPYADTSGLPTMLLCREVRRHVRVALCGDGGDECFGGYSRYGWFQRALAAGKWPRVFRSVAGRLARGCDRRRGARIARWLETRDPAGLYAEILRGWHATSLAQLVPGVAGADEIPVQLVRDVFGRVDADPLSQAAAFDVAYYIPDDLQVKVDRASMRFGLEVRCPLLDRRVMSAGAELSTSVLRAGGPKSVLRNVLARRLPRRLFERPKSGFAVPLAAWLAGPLRDRVADALRARVFRECGWLEMRTVQDVGRAFVAGRTEHAGAIWKLFVLSEMLQRAAAGSSRQPARRAA
ncbi:MAG: asparagine synthase (glutamine-hydrolyzing) [Planctomycetaceae bacterium]|nr:asparagine synthase (glutamine-hydrolyzing) [Planctomycetaceae bacterium]